MKGTKNMTKIKNAVVALHKQEDGAAFIEYTVLLGVILAVSIATVSAVGDWAANRWTKLNSSLP